jgi:hypothetical protein
MPQRHLFIAAAQRGSQTPNKKQSVAFFAAREWRLTGLPQPDAHIRSRLCSRALLRFVVLNVG